jgi:phosphohistidine phosphatase SixA
MVRAILCVLLAAFTCLARADAALVSQLREGGYVLYMRHASTDFSQNDARMTSYEDCASQRNLLDKGRDEARSVATHVQRLRIPIGEVLASPFCRTMETARLAFGSAKATNEARGGPARTDDASRYDPLRKLLSSEVKGPNRVVVSHGNPFHAVAGPPYLAEGEIAIVRPNGKTFSVLGRIRVEDWPALQ